MAAWVKLVRALDRELSLSFLSFRPESVQAKKVYVSRVAPSRRKHATTVRLNASE